MKPQGAQDNVGHDHSALTESHTVQPQSQNVVSGQPLLSNYNTTSIDPTATANSHVKMDCRYPEPPNELTLPALPDCVAIGGRVLVLFVLPVGPPVVLELVTLVLSLMVELVVSSSDTVVVVVVVVVRVDVDSSGTLLVPVSALAVVGVLVVTVLSGATVVPELVVSVAIVVVVVSELSAVVRVLTVVVVSGGVLVTVVVVDCVAVVVVVGVSSVLVVVVVVVSSVVVVSGDVVSGDVVELLVVRTVVVVDVLVVVEVTGTHSPSPGKLLKQKSTSAAKIGAIFSL